MANGRDDEIEVSQINRNRRLALGTTEDSPLMEEIEAGSATYGERLYDQMPTDKVGFMPTWRNKK